MTYGMTEFCDDCRDILKGGASEADLEKVRIKLEKLLENRAFVEEATGPDAPTGVTALYRDPELGFMVLSHNYERGRTSPPHDHGASWAVYGQARSYTDMTEYDRRDDGSVEGHAELDKRRTYRLEPGMAGKFPPHEIHSIHFPDGARFIRVTGTDLSEVETLRYDMDKEAVVRVDPNRTGEAAGSVSA